MNGPTVVVFEATRHPKIEPGDFDKRLTHLLQDVSPPEQVEEVCLNLRIAAPEIDEFSRTRGWAPAPDALIRIASGRLEPVALAHWVGGLLDGLTVPSRSSAMLVRERIVFETVHGTTSDAVTMVVQNWKRPDLTRAQYMDHWQNKHGPLVRELGPDMGFVRYRQSHRVEHHQLNEWGTKRGWRPSPDGGLTQVWWPSAEAMSAATQSAAGQTASGRFAQDEGLFVHPPAMSAFLASSCTF